MMSSMMSGISGLRNHQTAMDVIGNNIANVNTSGFKASRVLFKQVFSDTMANATAPNSDAGMGGTNPMQIGLGSAVSSIDILYTEGNIERTDNPLDVSIDGNGLFIIKAGDSSAYTFTRSGAFGVDKSGNLVTSTGALVCGWTKKVESVDPLEDGKYATTASVEPINIYRDKYNGNKQIIEPQATSYVVMSGNLNANTSTGDHVNVPMTLYDNYGNEIPASMKMTKLETVAKSNSIILSDVQTKLDSADPSVVAEYSLVDSAGNPVTWSAGLYVKKLSTGGYQTVSDATVEGALKVITDLSKEYKSNEWTYEVTINGELVSTEDGKPARGIVSFKNDEGEGFGKLNKIYNESGDEIDGFTLNFVASYDSSPDNQVAISFDFSSVTQYSAKDSMYVYDTNGYSTGTLTEYSIGSDGIITGIYTNGKQQSLGMIALASFENYSGLKSVGDSAYTQTANSGEFRAMAPETEAGTLTSNTLEMSNVDLSTEFTNLIIYQRGFQANSRGITTADEMLQELVNLKR